MEHPHLGRLWVRKLKNGGSILVGWLTIPMGKGKPKAHFAVKVRQNIAKPNKSAPDYIIHDYTKEKQNAVKISVHNQYQALITGYKPERKAKL